MVLLLPARVTMAQPFFAKVGQFILNVLLPSGYSQGQELRHELRSPEWKAFRMTVDDTTAMDAIYRRSLVLCGGNTKSALLASALGVLDHRSIPLLLPRGLEFDLPLTFESDDEFNQRVGNLPANIYTRRIDDRDKLQHFFFSGYLKRMVGMKWLCRTVGDIVELGEDLFVIGSVSDPRDKHANNDGVQFSSEAAMSLDARPSECLTDNP